MIVGGPGGERILMLIVFEVLLREDDISRGEMCRAHEDQARM
jgi:hypothetical protein